MSTIFYFIIVLGILIFFHELGHFLIARFFGVGIERFSLGFGPRLLGKTVGRTDYRISAIPLGGYVKMVGEEPDSEIDPADIPLSFTHKHVLKRFLIVAAGPLFNILLAVIIFYISFQIYGYLELKPAVGGVQEGSPAQQAGLQKGDMITTINGNPVDLWDDMARTIATCDGKTLRLTVVRDGQTRQVEITPAPHVTKMFGMEIKTYRIGIFNSPDHAIIRKLDAFQAIGKSVSYTWNLTKETVFGIGRLIIGTESRKNVGGPILIAQMAGYYGEKGILWLAQFIATISIGLAIINLLPIPVLDGGHLLFFLIEAIMGKPVNTRMREIAQQAGLLIIFSLIIFIFYNDLSRIFFPS